MDLRTLAYFVTVAEELNISRAAEKLHISQPPLSSQIKSLESELNTVLFIRGKRHLTITDSGKHLYARAKEILSLADKTSQEILTMKEGVSGTIHIGLVEGSAPNIAAEWIRDFLVQYPNVSFHVFDGNTDEIVKKLRSGLINLGITTMPCDRTLLNSFSVGSEQISAFMSVDHPLAKLPGDSIELKQLIGQKLIVPSRIEMNNLIYAWFRAVDSIPNVICRMDNYLDIAAMASRNVGICLFPMTSFMINPSIVSKTIINPERFLEYVFVWRKVDILPPAEAAFVDFVKSAVQNQP